MVDRESFEVGGNLALTPGAVVLRTPVFELLQYRATTLTVREHPLLVVPPMINNYYVTNLAPGRSMIEHLVANGQQVFAMSWRNPGADEAAWDLDTYAQAIVDAIEAVSQISGQDAIHAVGLRAGGITLTVAAAHLAAIGEGDRLAGLTLAVCVLDNERAGTTSAFADRPVAELAMARLSPARLPRRPSPRRRLRLAAPQRPDLELLGRQLPPRQGSGRLRHPLPELRYDEPARSATP